MTTVAEMSSTHTIHALDSALSFSNIAIAKSPVPLGSDGYAKMRGNIRVNAKRLSDSTSEEMEIFLDALTDLYSRKVTKDTLKSFNDKISDIGAIGRIFSDIENIFNQMNDGQRRNMMRQALAAMERQLKKLHMDLAKESMLTDSEEAFSYILLCQTIVFNILALIKRATQIESMSGRKAAENHSEIRQLSVFALARIEAFRRGKIDLDVLRQTLYILSLADINIPYWGQLRLSLEGLGDES